MKAQEFERIKRQLEAKRREADKAQGAIEQIDQRLREEFECLTVDEARQLLKQKRLKISELEKQLEIQYDRFERIWREQLDE